MTPLPVDSQPFAKPGRHAQSYAFVGLQPQPFRHLFALSADELHAAGIGVAVADDGYPCRIALAAPPAGARRLLLNYQHQSPASPYAAAGPISIAQTSNRFRYVINRVPAAIASRLLSLRAYDASHRMVDAAVCDGADVDLEIRRLLSAGAVRYLHAHFAERGCYAARVIRLADLPAELV